MMKHLLILVIIGTFAAFTETFSQEMPLVFDEENTAAGYQTPLLPYGVLPNINSLPDPFSWSDGRGRIENYSDWRYRRAEIKAEIEYYEIGEKPPRPDTIEASYADGVLTVIVTENGRNLTLTSQVILPEGSGPFPAVIGMNSPSGSIPSDIFSSRNIARITYNHNQVTTYGNPQNSNPYYQLYPQFNTANTGQYSAWAWGISRLIDGLELVQDELPIDTKHLAVTGCSYAGKMAIFAGAFDERIALTIGVESGGGGYTTWRYSEVINSTVSVETLGKTDYNWFKDDMKQFSSTVQKLPEDHHELMAMVAPRALLVTGNPDYTWLADESGYVGSMAAKEVWEALGVPDRFGFSIVGGHGHCALPNSQQPEVAAFVDKFLLGIDTVNTNVATTPYSTNLTNWITWDKPALANGTSYFGQTELIYPPNSEAGLDTVIEFSWASKEEAELYYIQGSTDPTFAEIAFSDSTADTVKTIEGLEKGQKYYWRIRIKTAAETGPWSALWNFITATPLPGIPELAAAVPFSNRPDYVTFQWRKTANASNYLVQSSEQESFNPTKTSLIVSDTARTFAGFEKEKKYYWRVQANNVTGPGPWSETGTFALIAAPSGLTVAQNETNEVVLNWVINSSAEDGFIIERKGGDTESFEEIQTIEGSVNTFTDSGLESDITYTYRVKAYAGLLHTEYTDEASLTFVVGVNDKNMPKDYSISQNYPNPFNPTTKINFALPHASLTKIIIYDLLGREVTTLIDKELEAGFHDIDVEAGNLTSGIYYYRIQAGDFTETKKMLLLK